MLPCELYLIIPPEFDAGSDLDALVSIIRKWHPAALRLDGPDERRAESLVNALRETVQRHDVALILTDLPALAAQTGCDGVHLSGTAARCALARAELGRDLQLGVFCGTSRDDAMIAGELGADYIAVAPDAPDLITWWSQMMELPVIAENVSDADQALAMARAGADFLSIPLDFASEDGAERQLAGILSRLAEEYPE
ncbi:thiamine phosphate synthase [Swaminathania salitolerans]|uniref:Thiamine-phosphate synthase n=1 Tax=Swaminathania salitolerans TaxID=182838 RepID=A0A511BSL4_9PROT|nr:thiamine phosphate synthase [Swaminathania salitolerans]GBQ13436.1 thiamine monophosphate synthase [Swaminathania salitolerans LMG 21291]GEL03319.1 thiamine-phosphate synthase [Swaminathania salitolerans]